MVKSQELNRLGLMDAGARVLKALVDHRLKKSVQRAGVWRFKQDGFSNEMLLGHCCLGDRY